MQQQRGDYKPGQWSVEKSVQICAAKCTELGYDRKTKNTIWTSKINGFRVAGTTLQTEGKRKYTVSNMWVNVQLMAK
jgi:hypothetical protein